CSYPMLTRSRPLTPSPHLSLPAATRAGLALTALVAIAVLWTASCGGGSDFVVGATTSIQDTDLLDVLTEAFRDESGYDVATVTPIVAGSGQILDLARRGEVDAVITHSPQAEGQLIADGDGVDRREIMQNFFVLVGPPDDPAGVRSALSTAEAFKRIAAADSMFISRGDNSGTHVRELSHWRQAGIDPTGLSWYQESGAGQGQSLLLTSDRAAYTLVDSSTFTVFQDRLDLEPLVLDEEPNQYSIIRVNPEKHSVNETAALAFAEYLTSPAAQRIIAEFGSERYGEPLFIPNAAATGIEPSASPES
ncbi:MAG: substrate-binding domain-containing protein, partial [Dehalococcoidia bacterium]